MLGMSCLMAFLACHASYIVAQSLVQSSSAIPADEAAAPSSERSQPHTPSVLTLENPEESSVLSLPEGENPAIQVATLKGYQVTAPARIETTDTNTDSSGEWQSSENATADDSAVSRRPQYLSGRNQNPLRPTANRRVETPTPSAVDTQEMQSEAFIPNSGARRRLQLLGGLPQLGLPQLGLPLHGLSSIFGHGLSPREKDQIETFTRRVATSRERVYKDLLFVTGGKFHGMDEFAMKQLVAKVGLENLSSGNVPHNHKFSRQETQVLEAARRSRHQIDRIINTYDREVAQHAKTLRRELQEASQQAMRGKIDSIVSDGLFKSHSFSIRRLQQGRPRSRRLSSLLQSPGFLDTAGSLLRSIDPSNITASLNAGLSGLGLNHLHLTNIAGRDATQRSASGPSSPVTDTTGLEQALQAIFSLPQQVTAMISPLRSFQQGVSTSTNGAIGAFLSREGLQPFLSVDTARRLLGGLIGGEAIAPHGASGWGDLGLPPAAAAGAASVMPFETFLSKLGSVAQEVDADVGVLKRETRRRIGAEAFPLLPEQTQQVEALLDRLVWGSLQAPQRRLQEIDDPLEAPESTHQPQQSLEGEAKSQPPQQQAEGAQQQPSPPTEEGEPKRSARASEESKTEISYTSTAGDLLNMLLRGSLGDDEEQEELEPEDEMESALQRVELLADAVTVLLREYERAVEQLQKLLDEQIETAEDIREELEVQVKDLQEQVGARSTGKEKKKPSAAADVVKDVAKVYDEAIEELRESLEGLLRQEQQKAQVPAAVQRELAAIAAKIEAASEANLRASPVSAH